MGQRDLVRVCRCRECRAVKAPLLYRRRDGAYGPPVAWRGKWWYRDRGGYYWHADTALHRAVHETHIGPIPKGYHVHHRNGARGDNRPENLVAMSPDEHKRHPHKRSPRPGHIRPHGKGWQIVVELEPDPLTGRRRRIYRTAKTENAAERLRARMVTEAADGTAQASDRRTVADLAEAWLTHIAPNRSPSTMINYRTKVKGYIVPNLGKVRLDRLKAVQLDGLYSTLRKSGGHEGKPLSAQTVRHVHAILHAMLAQGRKWGWVTRNPAEDATAPTPDPVDNDPPSPEQVAALYHQALEEDRSLALAIWVCAVAGTRRAEACGLRWTDLDGNMLAVARSIVVAGKGELRVKSTKTGKPRRVGLDAHTVELFAEHRRLAEERAEACRVDIEPTGFVLSESPSCADPLHPDVLTKRFQRLASKLGIDCHMHSLRHFAISVALGAGIPVLDVAKGAGHASARMTLDNYGHLMAVGSGAAEVISGALRISEVETKE